jgi:hypothetical protein
MLTLFTNLCLAAGLFQGRPALMPDTPDWRSERLEFPLSFAPQIPLQGYEELRFAPGMFDADAADYFTYVLGLRLDGDIEVERVFLTGFLEEYYRGLCESVAESRGLDLDLSGFAVSVEQRGPIFHARVDMVDVFVTAQPLRLQLELVSHPGPGSTEVLGVVSPSPGDAPIWEELRAMRESWQALRPTPVFLNHLYVIPDAETYDALLHSKFLREAFAPSEMRETVRADLTYSGTYFYGQRTYFEFLAPAATPGLSEGGTGVAFGVEREGATAELAERLVERGLRAFPGPATRETDGEQLPWFEMLGVEQPHARSRLNTFCLEYSPDFLKRWHPGLEPKAGGIDRRSVLERYAAKLGQLELRREGLLLDVTAVELALDAAERDRFLEVCRTFDYAVTESDGRWTCRGPGVELSVVDSETPGGVRAFTMSLRRAFERESLRLGQATLSFAGTTATLRFEP